MQATGVTPPILNLKSQTATRAQGYPNQDQFQSMLQSRISSRGYGSSSSRSATRSNLKSQLLQAKPAASSSTSSVINDRSKWESTRGALIKEMRSKSSLLQAEVQSGLNRLTGKTTGDSSTLAAAVVQPNTEMPALLKRLMEFLHQQPGQSLKVSPEQIQELKAFLQQAGLPAAQVDRLLNSDTFQTKGLTAQDVQAAWQEACQDTSQKALAAQVAQLAQEAQTKTSQQPLAAQVAQTKTSQQPLAAQVAQTKNSQQPLTAQVAQTANSQLTKATVELDMPPALKALTELLNQQPGQALKVTPDRVSQVQDFLLKAGIPPKLVENLLNSPQVQEQGLTAAQVQAAWLKGVQTTLKETLAASGSQLTAVQNLTGQPDYQSLWESLTLPPQALGDLRLELQKLGVPGESLTGLNQQNFPNGIPLSQVWELIQQSGQSSSGAANPEAATSNKVSNSMPLLNGGTDLAKWRQLLTQAGMDPELVQTLTSGPTPITRGELQATLAQMAPTSTPQGEESPKPLYLPGSLRVRQVPLLQQMEAGQGKGGGHGNLGKNLGSLPQAQTGNLGGGAQQNTGTADLDSYLASFNSNSPQAADLPGVQAANLAGAQSPDHAGAQVAAGNQTFANSYLTPEAREALWSQVQSGILGNLRPGENQVSLTLNPPDLGKLDLTLSLRGQTVEVTAITSHSAVAEAAAAGVQQLAQALNQQGLILTQFQFHHQDQSQGQYTLNFSQNPGDQKETGKKDPDKWERPPTPQRQWAGRAIAGGIDCFA